MHPPKILQIGEGHHVIFCVWKKSAIILAKGVQTIKLSIEELYKRQYK